MQTVLEDSSIWGGESTPVDLDLKNPAERSGHGWHLGLECKVLECCWVVVFEFKVCVLWMSSKM